VKVVVDFDLCQSNGICQGLAPEVFEVRDDGYLYLLQEHPDESLRSKVEMAVNSCPVQAISLVDGE
jgi:ferredoxin